MASQLDREIRLLAQREREVLAELLPKIRKMDVTQEFLDLDFHSLFAYLTKGVGYSEGSAQRRIDAARLMRHIPDLAEKLESGVNNLAQVGMMKRAAIVVGKKRKVTAEEQQTLFKQIEGKNGHESQIAVAKFFDIPVQKATSKKPQADGSVRLELTVSKELYANIQKAQELLSHAVRTNELVDYLEYLTNKVIAQKFTATVAVKPPKQAVAVKPPKQAVAVKPPKQSVAVKPPNQVEEGKLPKQVALKMPDGSKARAPKLGPEARAPRPTPKTITARIHREVRAAQPCCQHRDRRTGQLCGSRWQLQTDHKKSRWLGGTNDRENLQTLCGKHNRWKYRDEIDSPET